MGLNRHNSVYGTFSSYLISELTVCITIQDPFVEVNILLILNTNDVYINYMLVVEVNFVMARR